MFRLCLASYQNTCLLSIFTTCIMRYCLTVEKLRAQLFLATQLLSLSNVVTICNHVLKYNNKNICVEKLQK